MLSIEINNDVQLAAAFPGGRRGPCSYECALEELLQVPLFFGLQLIRNNLMAEDIGVETFIHCWQLRQNFDSLPNIRAFDERKQYSLYILCMNPKPSKWLTPYEANNAKRISGKNIPKRINNEPERND